MPAQDWRWYRRGSAGAGTAIARLAQSPRCRRLSTGVTITGCEPAYTE
jgi:hypothetical protein